MSIEYRIGDVRDRLAEIPDGTIDLLVTSPPFLALRSYLPSDHPQKAKEIGSEPTPAAFLDTLLALSAEFGRVLAPHGSICVELGDTFSGSGGAGGDYDLGGKRDGPKFGGSALADRKNKVLNDKGQRMQQGPGWPLSKSLTLIPELFPACLAYGRNLLTGEPSPAGLWRIRNIIVWARPNPPVGALGDKFRPATSYITVACRGTKRFFDLDAVRTELLHPGKSATTAHGTDETHRHLKSYDSATQSAGAPPLDWHTDLHPEDGDWLWKMATQPFSGSHYATFPLELPTRLIRAMCPQHVCPSCGPLQSNYEADTLRRMSGSDNEPTGQTVLFEDVRLEDYPPGQNGSGDNERPAASQSSIRLRGAAMAGSPDGKQVGGGVRASSRDGRSHWPDADARRGGASLEWDQGRQPNRESRAAPQEGARSLDRVADKEVNQALSPLRGTDRDRGTCPSCGGLTRPGVVLDPFAGSGTTLEAAQAVGRHAIGIDLDARNADLARNRVGMFLEITQ